MLLQDSCFSLMCLFWGSPGSSGGKERIHLQCRRPQFDSWAGKIPWRRDRLPTPVYLGFPGGSDGEEAACPVGDLGSVPQLGRSPGEGNGYSLQYSYLENSTDRGTWQAAVLGVAESDTTEQLCVDR